MSAPVMRPGRGLYGRLARNNLRSGRRLYLPYILTGICMVMIFYITLFLSCDKEIASELRGGGSMQLILRYGVVVVGLFALLFLSYTSNFLTRRRQREFGLYHVLGMEKRHIARVMGRENLLVAALSIGGGLLAGILLSKLAQLALLRMMNLPASFRFSVPLGLVGITAALFAVIYVLILLHALRQVYRASPVELLRGSEQGEKPPRANYVLALAGVLLLGAGYWLALTVQDALTALSMFFVAVILVILGTYGCLISGSVALLKLLRRNKRYYYRTKHFVSVSGMTFRMKRNGAGLASICILSTVVLVMLSSVTCLFAGEEEILARQYPKDLMITFRPADETDCAMMEGILDEALSHEGTSATGRYAFRTCEFPSVSDGNGSYDVSLQRGAIDRVAFLSPVPQADYAAMTGTDPQLAAGEALVAVNRGSFEGDTLTVTGGGETLRWTVRAQVEPFAPSVLSVLSTYDYVWLVLPSMDDVLALVRMQEAVYGEKASSLSYHLGCDMSGGAAVQRAVAGRVLESLRNISREDSDFSARHPNGYSYGVESAAQGREDFYSLYGGLFFLGVLLGFTFVLAAVLIMYYKQVTEGYEDRSRFEIMQKVGLTRREIRSSVHSQMLTVFFLPLVMAAVHLAFAFPMVEKLLLLFGMTNRGLFLAVAGVCLGVFGLFYAAVYAATSRVYLGIVSGGRERE